MLYTRGKKTPSPTIRIYSEIFFFHSLNAEFLVDVLIFFSQQRTPTDGDSPTLSLDKHSSAGARQLGRRSLYLQCLSPLPPQSHQLVRNNLLSMEDYLK